MLARKGMLIVYVSLFNYGLGIIALIIVARFMGPQLLGIIGFIGGYIGIFSLISRLGFDQAHLKRVSEGKDLGKCIGTYSVIQLSLTFVMVMVSLIFIFFKKAAGGFGFTEEIVFYILLFGTLFESVSRIPQITFGARLETAKAEIPKIFGRIAYASFAIFVAIYFQSVVLLALASLISAFSQFAVYFIQFRKYPLKRPDKNFFRSYKDFALPMMIIPILGSITMNADKIMIGEFINATEVGYYYVPQRIFFAFQAISLAIPTILFPAISLNFAKNNIKEIHRLVHTAEKYLSLIFFPISLIVIVFAEPIITIMFGQKFLPAVNILRIFSITMLINVLMKPYWPIVTGANHPKLMAKLSILCAPIIVILNILFIPKELYGIRLLGLGASGAAFATLITTAIQLPIFYYWGFKLARLKPKKHALFHFFAVSLTGILLYWCKSIVPISSLTYLISFSLLGLGIYLTILMLLKEFGKEDIIYIWNTVNPKQMGKYVKSEIKGK